jgi:drug/metabolite transporter (DMT)-like permease
MLLARKAVVPPALTGNVIALVSTVLWSSAFPATEYLLRGWDPLLLCAARLAGAALFILALTVLAGRLRELRRAPWGDVLLLGTFGVAAPVFLLVAGQGRTDAVTVAIVSTTLPLISALMSWWLDGRRPGALVAVGILLAISGGSLATTAARGGPDGPHGGELLILASMVAWIWYSRAALRRLSGHGDLALSGLTFAAGALVAAVVVAVALLLGLARPRLVLDELNIAALLWMSMIAIGLSVPLWFTSARMLGITIAAIHTNLAPFYVMLMALAFGGTVSSRQVMGAALVAAGALLAQLSAGRAPAARRP